MSSSESGPWRIVMADTGLGMFLARVAVWLGLAASAGFAYPWIMNWYLGRWASRLLIAGRSVQYSGSPGGLLVTWLKTWFFSLITLSLCWWLRGRGNAGRYFDAHLGWGQPG